MLEILHIGAPVKETEATECYNERFKVCVTDSENCKYRFQCIRFEENTPLNKEIVNNIHVAYKVDCLDELREMK